MNAPYEILYEDQRCPDNDIAYKTSWPELKEKIQNICERSGNLMISIFDIKRKTFLCCSNSFEDILGYSATKIKDGGWDFWFDRIDAREKSCVSKRITDFLFNFKSNHTIYLKYHLRSLCDSWYFIDHAVEKYSVCGEIIALNYICDYTERENMGRCLKPEPHKPYSGTLQDIHVSPREYEVLKLISDGFSSKQVADRLCISYHTAVSHRKHLIEKFKVLNTAQLIKRASELIKL